MSGELPKLLRISVTNGDALSDNRLKGHSNTGTYFVCSTEDWGFFKEFFEENVRYYIESSKTKAYVSSFEAVFSSYKNKMPDRLASLAVFGEIWNSDNVNYSIEIGLRKNDKRIFMRFVNNQSHIVNSFRHILYGELSNIIIEKISKRVCVVYPEINTKNINKTWTSED